VREYNTVIRTFPNAVTAKATGAKPRDYFEVTNASAREVPRVDFGGAPGAAAPAPAPAAGPATRASGGGRSGPGHGAR
jgi:LemA protein